MPIRLLRNPKGCHVRVVFFSRHVASNQTTKLMIRQLALSRHFAYELYREPCRVVPSR